MSEAGLTNPSTAKSMWDDGTGYYTKYNITQQDIYQNIIPDVLKVVDKVPFLGGVFVICDYGMADGGTSNELIGKCIGLLKKKYGADLQVQVVNEDLPSNDFRTLFNRISGTLDGATETSYYSHYSKVYVSAVGMSFYNQCLPDNSVHFGFSSTAFHYLSVKPCNLTGGLWLTDDIDHDERRQYIEQAARDWSHILLLRSRELTTGGNMFINCLGQDPQGRVSLLPAMHIFNAIWREMPRDKLITQRECEATNIVAHMSRTEEELMAPFKDTESDVYKSGLRLVSLHWTVTEDPLKANWEANKHSGLTAREHAAAYGRMAKVLYNILLGGLDNTRSEGEKFKVVDTFLQRFVDKVAENPDDFEASYVHASIHVRKEDNQSA